MSHPVKKHFLSLFEHNRWANEQYGFLLKKSFQYTDELLGLLNHIYAAQEVWKMRLMGRAPESFDLWPRIEIDDLVPVLKENSKDWLLFIDSRKEKDFETIIRYRNLKGEDQVLRLSDILTHVAMHTQYHRGQMAYLMRQENLQPPSTDYFIFAQTKTSV